MPIGKTGGSSRNWSLSPQAVLLTLVLALVGYVRIRLLQAPLERDEGEYAYMAQLLLKGVPPYVQAYTMKLPGVSGAYALIMTVFGQTAAGIHLGLLVVNGANAFLVYLLAKRLLDREAAVASWASFAVLSVSQSVLGAFAHATHFVVLFALSGLLLLLRYLDGRRTALALGSGLCFGLAFTMKQHAALLAVFAFLYLAWRVRRRRDPLSMRLRAVALFLLGTLAPYAVVALWLSQVGAFESFWFWTVLYAREYAAGNPLGLGWQVFRTQLGSVLDPQLPLWLLAGLGAALTCTPKLRDTDRLLILGLFLFSFLAICPGLCFSKHYFVLLLPAVALLIGAATTWFGRLLSVWKPEGAHRFLALAPLMVSLGYGVYLEKNYFFNMRPEVELSRSLYGTNPFPEAAPVARYLKKHTSSEDRIAVLGSEPEICFYADRISATGHIYMYGLMEDQPYAERMQRELIREIELAQPKYLVLTNVEWSWLAQPNSSRTVLNWVIPYLKERYEEVAATDYLDADGPAYLKDVFSMYRRKVTPCPPRPSPLKVLPLG